MDKRILFLFVSLIMGTTVLYCQYFQLAPATLPNNIITIKPYTPGAVPEDPLSGISHQSLVYEWINTGQYNSQPMGYVYVNCHYIQEAFELIVKADNNTGTNNENGIAVDDVTVTSVHKGIIANITTNDRVTRELTQWIKVKDFSKLSIGSYSLVINYFISN